MASKLSSLFLFSFFVWTELVFGAPRELVVVESRVELNQTAWVQTGQGWVIGLNGKEDLFILTPSHVIDGASKIEFYCSAKEKIDLELLGNSPTYDLALLKVAKGLTKCELKPLITLSDNPILPTARMTSESVMGNSGFRYATKDGEDFVAGVIIDDPKTTIQNRIVEGATELAPYRQSLITEIAIRPGMSGAAYVMAQKREILGMATKTRINDHRSLVIPLAEIIPLLPDLMAKHDPWALNNPNLQIRFDLKNENKTLIRQRVLDFKVGDKEVRFSEQCSHSSYKMSSEWQLEGGSWADGGGSWADGGGSWADSSGHLHSRAEYSGRASYSAETANQLYLIWGYYKDLNPCKEEGIRIDSAKVLIGINDPQRGRYLKLDDLNALLALGLEKGSSLQNYIEQYGIFKGVNDKSYEIICRKSSMGRFDRLQEMNRQKGSLKMILLGKDLMFTYETESHWAPATKSEPWIGRSDESSIKCEDIDENHPRSLIKIERLGYDYSFYFALVPGGVAGMFLWPAKDSTMSEPKFIEDRFNLKDGNFWNHIVKTDKGAVLQINLNPMGRIVEMSLLSVPTELNDHLGPQFSRYENLPLWLLKYNVELDEETRK